ncbi:primosomal protein N' [Candidatus Sumerlaeota bacterium]|nr:primosomal protein N' [Candidatus Sumerlaeota bacterium]
MDHQPNLPYADVALQIPAIESYQYAVPPLLEDAIVPGALVRVPVKGGERSGCVLRRTAEKKAKRHKSVMERLTPDFRLSPELLTLGGWMAEYYMCGLGEALQCISFIGFKDVRTLSVKKYGAADEAAALHALSHERLTDKQRAVLEFFLQAPQGAWTAEDIQESTNSSRAVTLGLVKRGLARERRETVRREDDYPTAEGIEPPLKLTEEQSAAFQRIIENLDAQRFGAHLLHGVTGSGKTEIYLQAIGRTLEQGRQAIVLVPEISLTPQTIERFRKRFGARVGVYNSALNIGQKYDLYLAIQRGEIDIVIGARSAVFTPFPRLGLIVIDEEQEASYKQDSAPRYHARDVALMRASKTDAAVIMGTATPSLEAYRNAEAGKFALLCLRQRPNAAPLPPVRLIDMQREAMINRNTGLFSLELIEEVNRRLEAGEQSILFLNRRGYNPIVMCRECGYRCSCEHDDILLTYHKRRNMLVCHLCGQAIPMPSRCPQCESKAFHAIGMGTERIEEEVAEAFPGAKCLRIDLDTTSSKFSYLEKWREINEGGVDIILGTQMIAKGFDLPRVTLVGVVMADVSLFQPDFRASERTFNLLTQVAGRAGRRDKEGLVCVQTYCPDHFSILCAQKHDYAAFYNREIRYRATLRLPPHTRLIGLLITGADPDQTQRMARVLRGVIDRVIRAGVDDALATALGPAPAAVAYINKKYRWRLLLRGGKPSVMRSIVSRALADFEQHNPRSRTHITIDVDPLDLM